MSEVKRYRFKGAAGEYAYAGDFDNAAQCFLTAAEGCVAAERREKALQLRLNAADQRNDELLTREAALREELDTMTAAAKAMRDEWRVDQERLAAAEQRNARYESLLRQIIPCLAMSTNSTAPTYIRQINEALPKPAESGASE